MIITAFDLTYLLDDENFMNNSGEGKGRALLLFFNALLESVRMLFGIETNIGFGAFSLYETQC